MMKSIKQKALIMAMFSSIAITAYAENAPVYDADSFLQHLMGKQMMVRCCV